MKRFIFISIFSSLLIATSGIALAQPYGASGTLGPAGATNRTCDSVPNCVIVGPTDAWQSAITGMAPGSTVLMRAGTYTPTTSSVVVPAGTASAPNIVANFAGELPTITRAVSMRSHTRLEGVTVDVFDRNSGALFIETGATLFQDILLDNVELRGGTGDGVRIKGNVRDVTVRDSILDGGRANHGVLVECELNTVPCSFPPENVLIENNRFSKTTFAGVATEDLLQLEGHGDVTVRFNDFGQNQSGEQCIDIKRSGRSGAVTNILFNDMDARAASGCRIGPFLVTQSVAGMVLVEGNHFHDGSTDLRATPAGSRVQNNIFRGVGTNEAEIVFSPGADMTFGFNTMFGPDNVMTFGDSAGPAPASLEVTNNIFDGTAFRGTSWSGQRSFNLLFGTTGSTLGSCPTCITGQDPLLGGPDGYDLQAGSPAIDAAGGTFTVATDIDGVTRPQGAASDIGAFEFEGEEPPPDTTPPSIPQGLTATVVSDSRIDLAWEASTDDVGVVGYDVLRPLTEIATVTGTAYSDTGLEPGTYTYRVRAKDAAGNLSEPSEPATATIEDEPPPVGSADIKVAASNHDAEYTTGGSIRTGDQSDLEMVLQGSTRQQVCVLFVGVPIPPGVVVTLATIQFTADSGSSGNVSSGSGHLLIRAIDEDLQTACGSAAGSRSRTSASVTWSSVPTWVPGAKTAAQLTPNLAPVAQEVVDRVNWGGNLAFWITSSSNIRRNAESFNGNAHKAAVLHVEWE